MAVQATTPYPLPTVKVCIPKPDFSQKNLGNFPFRAPSHLSHEDSRLLTSCPLLVPKMKWEVSNFIVSSYNNLSNSQTTIFGYNWLPIGYPLAN